MNAIMDSLQQLKEQIGNKINDTPNVDDTDEAIEALFAKLDGLFEAKLKEKGMEV